MVMILESLIGSANKITNNYVDEMIETVVTTNKQEELNMEIFKQTAREKDLDPSKVRGLKEIENLFRN